jgi:hypothetical protein
MMHTSDATALFAASGDDDKDVEDDIDGAGCGDDLDVHGIDSRGGSPLVDEEDEDAILVRYLLVDGGVLLIWPQWEETPPPTRQHAVSFSPPPSTQPRHAASLSPAPSTQPHHVAPAHPIKQKAVAA